MKLLDHINNAIFSDKQQITEEVIDYFEKNPDELDLIINKEHFNALFLGIFFTAGIIITFLARTVQYFYGDFLGKFVNTVLLDVLSEFGIAIFGGAVVAYLIEFLNKRQYQRNLKFRSQVKAQLQKRKEQNDAAKEA